MINKYCCEYFVLHKLEYSHLSVPSMYLHYNDGFPVEMIKEKWKSGRNLNYQNSYAYMVI